MSNPFPQNENERAKSQGQQIPYPDVVALGGYKGIWKKHRDLTSDNKDIPITLLWVADEKDPNVKGGKQSANQPITLCLMRVGWLAGYRAPSISAMYIVTGRGSLTIM